MTASISAAFRSSVKEQSNNSRGVGTVKDPVAAHSSGICAHICLKAWYGSGSVNVPLWIESSFIRRVDPERKVEMIAILSLVVGADERLRDDGCCCRCGEEEDEDSDAERGGVLAELIDLTAFSSRCVLSPERSKAAAETPSNVAMMMMLITMLLLLIFKK